MGNTRESDTPRVVLQHHNLDGAPGAATHCAIPALEYEWHRVTKEAGVAYD